MSNNDDRERDCPKCGSETELPGEVGDLRVCSNDDCNWRVAISGTTTRANL